MEAVGLTKDRVLQRRRTRCRDPLGEETAERRFFYKNTTLFLNLSVVGFYSYL